MERNFVNRKNFVTKVVNNKWIQLLGDCPTVDKYISNNHGCCGILLDFLNCVARGISQLGGIRIQQRVCLVSFSNNPFTGFVVCLALFSVHYSIGIGALVGASVSVATAKILRLNKTLITSGLTTYNGALVGIVTTSLLNDLYSRSLSSYVWGFIVVGASISVIFNSCITNLLSSPKHLLPPLTISFNIIQLLIFACLMPPKEQFGSQSLLAEKDQLELERFDFNSTAGRNQSLIVNPEVNLLEFFTGVIFSVGQAHGIQNFYASLTIILGILIYSPLHVAIGIFGAALASLCGLLLSPVGAEYTEIYLGLWGYNGFLASVAIASIFFLPTFHSLSIAVVNVVSAAVLQRGCQLAFQSINLPYLTIPYVLTTLTFLQIRFGHGEEYPILVKNISFPEKHLYQHYFPEEDQKEGKPEGEGAEMSCHACSQCQNCSAINPENCQNNNHCND